VHAAMNITIYYHRMGCKMSRNDTLKNYLKIQWQNVIVILRGYLEILSDPKWVHVSSWIMLAE